MAHQGQHQLILYPLKTLGNFITEIIFSRTPSNLKLSHNDWTDFKQNTNTQEHFTEHFMQ
jgi:hypothetical protein